MDGISSYGIQLCAGALLVSVITALCAGDRQIKWICGMVLIFLAIAPIRKLDWEPIWEITDEIDREAQAITTQAQEETLQSIRTGIIERTRAYILDEAEALGTHVQVIALALDEAGLFPVRVELQGNLSPYDRSVLSDLLEKHLGIGKEDQIWMD